MAITNPHDQWHQKALEASRSLQGRHLVTTQEILTEYLNFLGSKGSYFRGKAREAVRRMESNPSVEIVPQSHESFQTGLVLFENRPDKAYSLTDCISMAVVRTRGITEVLTHDHHFEQEGLVILMRP